MKKSILTICLSTLLATCASNRAAVSNINHSQDDRDARMEWWREARFGMFIHWGLYAVPAGTWGKDTHHGEWIMNTAHIPVETYEKFLDQFNPIKFDAGAWARMAKNAGMKYIVITSKHHDGFCLWDSKYTKYNVMSTPFHRDILKELDAACKKEGIKLCFYHSIMDWHHPDYLPRRDWEKRPTEGADFNRYVQQLSNQISELLTTFKDIGVLWFDGEWENTWNHGHGQALYDLCRKLRPDLIINNRVDKGRGGMGGMSDAGFAGDYGTPEQEIPSTGLPGVDWETCMTMNDNWGYNSHDKHFKSAEDLIRKLCDIASKGGNFLLNIGPMGNGEFPPESVERLARIGDWTRANGESIYGTTASPFDSLAFGRCTQKQSGADTKLYFHIFDWPADGRLVIPGLGNKYDKPAWLLADPSKKFETSWQDGNLTIQLPAAPASATCPVVVLETKGKPIVYKTPIIEADSDQFVNTADVKIACESKGLTVRFTVDGSNPAAESAEYKGSIGLDRTIRIKARAFHDGKPVAEIADRQFTKVKPWAAGNPGACEPGVRYQCFDGAFDKVPDFSKLQKPTSNGVEDSIQIPKEARRAHVCMRMSGWLAVPADEMYQFALGADDGAILTIDGHVVVNNDGLHPMAIATGAAPLAAGAHRIEVSWFNGGGDFGLDLKWAQTGQPLTPVSKAALSHEK
ncbi:MAG: alpha-L-fucosidase [Planctomycetes bacterium]|nr:alpha-L-fucosidase [Planctomycetota bacterium]